MVKSAFQSCKQARGENAYLLKKRLHTKLTSSFCRSLVRLTGFFPNDTFLFAMSAALNYLMRAFSDLIS